MRRKKNAHKMLKKAETENDRKRRCCERKIRKKIKKERNEYAKKWIKDEKYLKEKERMNFQESRKTCIIS